MCVVRVTVRVRVVPSFRDPIDPVLAVNHMTAAMQYEGSGVRLADLIEAVEVGNEVGGANALMQRPRRVCVAVAVRVVHCARPCPLCEDAAHDALSMEHYQVDLFYVNGIRSPSYTYDDYVREFTTYERALRAVAGAPLISG